MQNTSAKTRILVAEDNPANQAVLRMQLAVLNYEVDIADDGNSALEKWRLGQYALILADKHMPGMDGLELTKSIRALERERQSHIPIIAITAVQYADELNTCLAAGMDDVLIKPIEMSALRSMLKHWLTSETKEIEPVQTQTNTRLNSDLLDIEYLKASVGILDETRLTALIELFVTTTERDIASCYLALEQHHTQPVALYMHKLKSSARAVGAKRFATVAQTLELEAKLNHLAPSLQLLQELTAILTEIKNALSNNLAFQPEITSVTPSDTPTQTTPAIKLAQLMVCYEPAIELPSRHPHSITAKLTGFEQPELTTYCELIKLASHQGLSSAIFEILLTKALLETVTWSRQGHRLNLELLISASWLNNRTLPDTIFATLQALGVSAKQLVFVVLADEPVVDFAIALEVINRLQLKGAAFALQDMGITELTLCYLQRMPVQYLKLKSDSIAMLTQHDNTHALLDVLNRLNPVLSAVAITNQQQFMDCLKLNCQFVQGTFIAPTMDSPQLLAWLAQQKYSL